MPNMALKDWIGNNHAFVDAPVSIRHEAEQVFKLPADVQIKFLPEKRLSVRELLEFAGVFPSQSKMAVNMDVQAFYSRERPTDSIDYQELERLHFPPADMLKQIIQTKDQAWTDGMVSVTYTHLPSTAKAKHTRYPLWIITFWAAMDSLWSSVLRHWMVANVHLIKVSNMAKIGIQQTLVKESIRVLSDISWSGHVAGFEHDEDSITELWRYCSRHWMSDVQITQMMHILCNRIALSPALANKVEVVPIAFFVRLHQVHGTCEDTPTHYESKQCVWVKRIGTSLENGTCEQVTGAAFVDNNHWVSITVDVPRKKIWYGDSKRNPCPEWLESAMLWWMTRHGVSITSLSPLKSTAQVDGYSFRILMVNALHHHFFPETLLINSSEVDYARLEQFLMVINRHSEHNQAFTPRITNARFTFVYPLRPPSRPSTPVKAQVSDGLLQSLSALKVSQENILNLGSHAPLSPSPNLQNQLSAELPMAGISVPLLKRTVHHPSRTPSVSPEKKRSHTQGDSAMQVDTSKSNPMVNEPTGTAGKMKKKVNGKPFTLKPKSHKRTASASVDIGSDEEHDGFDFATLIDDDDRPAKGGCPAEKLLRKISQKCHIIQVDGSMVPRFRCLGVGCRQTWAAPRNRTRVLKHATNCSRLEVPLRREASQMIAADSLGAQVEADTIPEPPKPCHKRFKPGTATPALKPPTDFFGKAGHDHHKCQPDFAIMKLICATGIAPSVVRSAEWKDVFKIASPSYIPSSASTIEGSQIPAEASRVRHEQESYLVRGHEASDVSHTAQHIENVITEEINLPQVIDSIGVEHFSAIASDSASNAKKPRLSVCNQNPTLISFYDATHATNLPCKDISKLLTFVGTIKEIRQMDLGHGLESIGKTRFATICWAALSVQRCLPAIRHLVSTNQVTIKKANHLFVEESSSALRFAFRLNRLIMILLPFAKAILCFEAAHLTASDVYVFWLAITASVKDVIDNPENDLDEPTASEIRTIINYRFRELFQDGQGDVYVAAFYLDPRYQNSHILLKPNPLSNTIISLPGKSSKPSNYLGTLLQNEFSRSKRHPSLVGLSAAIVSTNFKAQFASYAREQFPFANPIQEDQSVLDWWRTIADHLLANMLAVGTLTPLKILIWSSHMSQFVAIKLFSVMPSSMADERTMSTFTWLNSPLCNRQLVSTVVDMAQKRTRLRPVVKFGSLNLNLKCGQLPTSAQHVDTQEDLDTIEDPEGPIDWLDGEMEKLDASTESFDVESSVNLGSSILQDMLANDSNSYSRRKKENRVEIIEMAEVEPEVSWGWS
ncbi:hypothetical protein K439DRAFT_1612419 [Ramaria rubella]|nr:hypothetical protein K439DRAFT_1612419 [Ramaria rubella]